MTTARPPARPHRRNAGSVNPDRDLDPDKSTAECPLCRKTFNTGTRGWQGHIGSHHKEWHPELTPEQRCEAFKHSHPEFFRDALTRNRRTPPGMPATSGQPPPLPRRATNTMPAPVHRPPNAPESGRYGVAPVSDAPPGDPLESVARFVAAKLQEIDAKLADLTAKRNALAAMLPAPSRVK